MCVSSEKDDNRCVELRFICAHYRYVAVYLPDFPEVFLILLRFTKNEVENVTKN